MKYQRAVLITAAILALGLLVSGPALSAQGQATIERTLQVQPGGTLTVDSSFGHIKVLTASGNSVAVRVEREVRDSYSSDESRILTEHQVNISQSGNDVRVETMVSEDVRERWRDDYRSTPLRVEIVVTVPTSYNVDLDTAGGHIEVADLTGGVQAHTSGGHLTFGNIDGSINADTSGGHITLRGSSGTADLHTSGGHIEIGQVEGSIKADTSGGHITIDSAGRSRRSWAPLTPRPPVVASRHAFPSSRRAIAASAPRAAALPSTLPATSRSISMPRPDGAASASTWR